MHDPPTQFPEQQSPLLPQLSPNAVQPAEDGMGAAAEEGAASQVFVARLQHPWYDDELDDMGTGAHALPVASQPYVQQMVVSGIAVLQGVSPDGHVGVLPHDDDTVTCPAYRLTFSPLLTREDWKTTAPSNAPHAMPANVSPIAPTVEFYGSHHSRATHTLFSG